MVMSCSPMAVCKALISLSVILAWRSSSFYISSRFGHIQRYGSTYLNLVLQPASSAVLVPDVSSFLDALKFPSERLKAIKRLTEVGEDSFPLSAGDCKMIMAAVIETKSEDLLLDALRLFKSSGYFNSELMYVGIRIACKKKVWSMAYRMLLEVQMNGLVSDTDAVNSVIQLLARYGKINEAWNVLELAHNRKFGPDAECDLSSYFMVISCAGRAHSDVMVKAFKMMEKNFRVEIDENIFLVALNSCSLAGDFPAAIEIFAVYERLYGVVQTRAYCLLLMSYVSSKESLLGVKTPKLDAVVTFLVRSNIDSSATMANLIFQFFCVREDASRAAIYLDRMHTLNHRPSTNALLSYVNLVLKLQDRSKAVVLHAFMSREDFIPPPALVKLCLESLHEVPSAETAAQIFRNALVRTQETNTAQFLAVAQLCVEEKKFSAITIILKDWLSVLKGGYVWLSSSDVVSLVELLLVKMPLQYLQPILPSLIKIFTDITPAQFEKQILQIQSEETRNCFMSNDEKNEFKERREYKDSDDSSKSVEQNSGIVDPSSKAYFDEMSEFTIVSDIPVEPIIPENDPVMNILSPTNTSASIAASLLLTAWRSFRLSGYLRIVEGLLQRGGCEVSLQNALRLLQDFAPKEGLGLHQSQIRSLLHTAIHHDHGPGSSRVGGSGTERIQSTDGPSTYGNGVRVFLALRELRLTKPDEVVYKMVIKSLVKRRKRIQAIARALQQPFQLVEQSTRKRDDNNVISDSDLGALVFLLQAMAADGIKPSSLIHREVLFFHFSHGDIARASAYFKEIEREVDLTGGSIEPSLAEMYLSHMLQLEDPTEALATLRRLEAKQSLQSDRNLLLGDSPSGKLKVGALLYAKVVNVLLRANRTEDADALIPIIEAKNLTLGSSHVHLFMSQELRMGCASGAVDAFGMFFPNLDTTCPDSRAVSVLSLALKRLNATKLSADYARRLHSHIDELGPQLRPPVYGLFARFASEGGYLDEASGYLLKVPLQDRRQVPLCELAKYCVGQKRPDLVVSLLNGSPSSSLSPELVGHTIASFARSGLHVQALTYEELLTEGMGMQNRLVPWGIPFLLLSAAQQGYRVTTKRIMEDFTATWKMNPSELDFNLAVFAHLRAGLTAESDSSSNFGDLFALLYRMKKLQYGLHPIVRDFDPFHPSVPEDLRDLLCGVKMSMALLERSRRPSALITPAAEEDESAVFDGYLRASTTDLGGSKNRESPVDKLDDYSLESLESEDGVLLDGLSKSLFELNEVRNSGNKRDNEIEYMDDIFNDIEEDIEDLDEMKEKNILIMSKNGKTADEKKISSSNVPIITSYSNTEEDSKSKNSYAAPVAPARVWKPTNTKNIGTVEPDQYPKKTVKKNVSWPLKSVFMFKDENNNDEKDGNYLDESDNDESYSDGQEERESEGDVPLGDYFDDTDWLLRKTKFVNFSPTELEDMNLMDSLCLFPSTGSSFSSVDEMSGDLSGSESESEGEDSRSYSGASGVEFGPGSNRGADGNFRSRRRMGRSGARIPDQETASSSNLDALLSMGNFNSNTFLGSTYGVEKNNGSVPNSAGVSGMGPPSSSTALSEAAKRANLMHNMRRLERIELLTNKRKDR